MFWTYMGIAAIMEMLPRIVLQNLDIDRTSCFREKDINNNHIHV